MVLDGDMIEFYGVQCATLGKSIPSLVNKDSEPSERKRAFVQILEEQLGKNVSEWDRSRLEVIAKGFLGAIWWERTGRHNHSRLSFALSELLKWALEPSTRSTEKPLVSGDSLILLNHITRVLFHGDSSRWTKAGQLGLGCNACEEGDVLYAILGCRRLMALRRNPASNKFRIIGKFDLPGYDDGEAFLGELADGWKASYQHLMLASNRPRFEHENGAAQWHDPRMSVIPLPEGWHEVQDEDGCPCWCSCTGEDHQRSYFDPRLAAEELMERGVKLEKLVII